MPNLYSCATATRNVTCNKMDMWSNRLNDWGMYCVASIPGPSVSCCLVLPVNKANFCEVLSHQMCLRDEIVNLSECHTLNRLSLLGATTCKCIARSTVQCWNRFITQVELPSYVFPLGYIQQIYLPSNGRSWNMRDCTIPYHAYRKHVHTIYVAEWHGMSETLKSNHMGSGCGNWFQ